MAPGKNCTVASRNLMLPGTTEAPLLSLLTPGQPSGFGDLPSFCRDLLPSLSFGRCTLLKKKKKKSRIYNRNSNIWGNRACVSDSHFCFYCSQEIPCGRSTVTKTKLILMLKDKCKLYNSLRILIKNRNNDI